VAVLPFEGVPFEKEEVVRPGLRQINYPNNGEIVGDMLMTEMMSIPDFEYVERTQIQRILQEQNLSMTTLIKGKTTSEIGKLLGADAAVLGKVNKFQGAVRYGVGFYWVSFSARMVDTSTGTVLWSATVNRRGMGHSNVPVVAREECAKIVSEVRAKLARDIPNK
jgi:curli biogenesis system outer membrane secretion channel CsgG